MNILVQGLVEHEATRQPQLRVFKGIIHYDVSGNSLK